MDLTTQNAYLWATKNVWFNLLLLFYILIFYILILEYGQDLDYYPFMVKLDWCVGCCNTINDLSNEVCVPNKTEDLCILEEVYMFLKRLQEKMNQKF